MRFQISYRGGTTHEVELASDICLVGRDPSCDIVLNDTKCSRRHAVVESGPEGLVIKDMTSANGIYVNGKRVETSPLRPGDTVRLGEVTLTLLAELGETVVMASEDIELGTAEGTLVPPREPEPAPIPTPAAPVPLSRLPTPLPPPRRPPASRPSREPRAPRTSRAPNGGRPATVSLLAGLWAVFVPASCAAVLLAGARLHVGWLGWLAAATITAVLAGLGIAMALGLRALAPWARHLQIATAAVGLVACPFTLAAATVLLYMTRPDVRAAFEGSPAGRAGGDSAEPTFALSLAGMLVLGLALTAIAVLLF
jgi:hypothetical protein